MKMTQSKDGLMRATVRVAYRISEHDREKIAFVFDYDYDKPRPKKRLASYKEVVEAIKDGYMSDEFWREDDVRVFYKETEDKDDA